MKLSAQSIILPSGQPLHSTFSRNMFKVPGATGECPPVAKVISLLGQPLTISFYQLWQDGNVIKSRMANWTAGQDVNVLGWIMGIVSEAPDPQQRIQHMAATWIQSIDKQGYTLMFPEDETFANQLYGFKGAVLPPSQVTDVETRPQQPGQLLNQIPPGCPLPVKAISGGRFANLVKDLNANHLLADKLDLDTMGQLLKDSEELYFNAIDDPEFMLEDKVYNYIKDLYRVRMFAERQIVVEGSANSGRGNTLSGGRQTGMEHVPEPVGRMVKLPVWMGSLSKVQHGDGKLNQWKQNYPGPYMVAAKLDGASALRFWENGKEKLYSRGKNGMAQDLSELLPYLQLPILDQGVMIRGELILRKDDFNTKYKRANKTDKGGYRNARNAVGSGLVNKIGCRIPGSKSIEAELDIPFMADVKYVVYEAISTPMAKISDQYAYLEMRYGMVNGDNQPHCEVAPHFILEDVTEEDLSAIHEQFEHEMYFEIDGVVVTSDHVYDRPYGSNPDYARAYKKPLASLMAVTTVTHVTWKLSKDKYLKPKVHFLPIELVGSTTRKATGNNASHVFNNQLGPGSVIEVIRSNSIIPMIISFIKPSPTGPQMPTQKSYWSKNKVDLILDESELDEANVRLIMIERMRAFLKLAGVKGVASAKLASMYDIGAKTIPLLFAVRPEHIAAMGPKASQNVVTALQGVVGKIPLPIMAAGSGAFGRSIGVELMTTLFNAYPGILQSEAVQSNNIQQLEVGLLGLPDYGPERAASVARGFAPFLDFLRQLYAVGYPVVTVYQPAGAKTVTVANHPLKGMNIAMTGFHQDTEMNNFIPSVGANLQKAMRSDTNMLIVADEGSENNKTRAAQKKGVTIITRDQFRQKYMQ